MDMRGLSHFIRDIRKASESKVLEEQRVNKELAKIRKKFIETNHMSLYDRRKYVCKLMFISILGYPVTFGHIEGIKLMAEFTPPEKLIGYLSITVLLNENDKLLTLTTHTVFRDLMSSYSFNRSLALTAIANTGGKDFAEVMHEGVQQLVTGDGVDDNVRKKALLTLLCIYKKYPEMVDLPTVVPKVAELLLSSQDSVSICAVTFLTGCFSKENERLFASVPSKLITVLSRIILDKLTVPGYVYYGVPAPWLQSKVLRLLQYFPPPSDPLLSDRVIMVLRKIFKATDKVLKDAQTQQKQRGTQNRVSAMNSVLLEVISLLIRWNVGHKILQDCLNIVGAFIGEKREANLRYVGLTLFARLSFVEGPEFDFQAMFRQYQLQIIVSLHDPDVSIRNKSLEVLEAVCKPANVSDIIKELIAYLPITSDSVFKNNLILSIALLAEKYCDDYSWYVDIMLTIVTQAGDVCPPAIVYRVIHVIVNDPSVQKRATSAVFSTLKNTKGAHQVLLRVAAFVFGEFGYQIALNAESTPQAQFTLLHKNMAFATVDTQAMVLSTFLKFYNLYDDVAVKELTLKALKTYRSSMCPELQQRAVEYVALIEHGGADLREKVLEPMPAFDDNLNPVFELLKKARATQTIWENKMIKRDGSKSQERAVTEAATPTQTLQINDLTSSGLQSKTKEEFIDANNAELDALFHVSSQVNADEMRQAYANHRKLFTSQLLNKSGVLFSDNNVEVECSQVYNVTDARLLVTVRDRSGQGQKNLSLEILSSDVGLLVQSRQRDGNEIAANHSVDIEFAARSLATFVNPPSVRLQYTPSDGIPRMETLSLPVVTTRFISPYSVNSDEQFFEVYDSATRTVPSSARSIISHVGADVASIVHTLEALGFTSKQMPNDIIAAVGAHATQPHEEIKYAVIACKIQRIGGETSASVFAADAQLHETALNVMELFL